MEKKGRRMKMEKIRIAAIVQLAFVGTVFILRNVGDKR